MLKWLIYYHLFWCYILDMGELFTVPQCQEFLVTVQSDPRGRLRKKAHCFPQGCNCCSKTLQTELPSQVPGVTAEVSGLIFKWMTSKRRSTGFVIIPLASALEIEYQNCCQQNNLTLGVGSSVISPLEICWSHIMKSSDSQLCFTDRWRLAELCCRKRLVLQGSVVAQSAFRKLTVIHEQDAKELLPLLC